MDGPLFLSSTYVQEKPGGMAFAVQNAPWYPVGFEHPVEYVAFELAMNVLAQCADPLIPDPLTRSSVRSVRLKLETSTNSCPEM